MSMNLSEETRPPNLIVWAPEGDQYTVFVGGCAIPIKDFMQAVGYVLTNKDLDENDPRLGFIKDVKSMKQIEGFNKGGKRLVAQKPVFLPEPIIFG